MVKSCLGAQCFKEGYLDVPVSYCPVCNVSKPLVEIHADTDDFAGPEVLEDGMEKYEFSMCRANCSSSRDHHKSRFVLKIDPIPGTDLVRADCLPLNIISPPFVLQARMKIKRGAADVESSEAPRSKIPMRVPGSAVFTSSSSYYTIHPTLFRNLHHPLEDVLRRHVETFVSLHVCLAEDGEMLDVSAGEEKILRSIATLHFVCATAEDAHKAVRFTNLFMENAEDFHNPLNQPLCSTSMFAFLGASFSWQ